MKSHLTKRQNVHFRKTCTAMALEKRNATFVSVLFAIHANSLDSSAREERRRTKGVVVMLVWNAKAKREPFYVRFAVHQNKGSV
jgi:hypothetical protein